MKVIAMIPTYNEAGNVSRLVRELLALPLPIEVVVVDDNSPDGTAAIVQGLALADRRVHLLLRKENRGRGWAGIDGFRKALDLGADLVVEMDGDHSHAPRFIPAFVTAAAQADIVIGSRYISGGKDEERSLVRHAISNFARRYLALVLGVTTADPTSGFRLFTRNALEKILPFLKARDPFIVSEVLFYAHRAGLRIVESPIEFMSRGAGASKLKSTTLLKYLLRVWQLRLRPGAPHA